MHVLAAQWGFGELLWAMLVFFFWVMAIWLFITVVADIFMRRDIGGWHKAGWLLVVFVLPFFGVLIYLIARPAEVVRRAPQEPM
jgi:Phospholipase_D-nuclease N-terminal